MQLMKMRDQIRGYKFYSVFQKFKKIYQKLPLHYMKSNTILNNFFLLFTSEHFLRTDFTKSTVFFSIDPLEYLCCPVSQCNKSLVLIVCVASKTLFRVASQHLCFYKRTQSALTRSLGQPLVVS